MNFLPLYKSSTEISFLRFGANTKILHFIGVVKPWLQNFDSQSQRVQTPAGYQHLTGFLQDWWNIFCESVHPNLDTTMVSSLTLTQPLLDPAQSTVCQCGLNVVLFFEETNIFLRLITQNFYFASLHPLEKSVHKI
jgi:lipopolysaccharide biosynthesis glycosyltransferase